MAKVFLTLVLLAIVATGVISMPIYADQLYGPPGQYLSEWQIFRYSASLLWYDSLLTSSADPSGTEQVFEINPGDSIFAISENLQASGLIKDAGAFRVFLIYRGMDVTVQSGQHRLSPVLSIVEIAEKLQDATPLTGTLIILPGWRMEEIAASLPTSGLNILPEDFLSMVASPAAVLDYLPEGASAEGFLFPGTYELPRGISASALVITMLENFSLYLSPEMQQGFSAQGLSVYEALILSSIVEREAIVDEEKPLIASVYINRVKVGMRLEADPTVQYALGWSAENGWWKSPLSLNDLQVVSAYNTYQNAGLPPTPISNPDLLSIKAVAFPEASAYYFFRADCDGSGRHKFAETFEQHLANGCP